VGLAYPAPQGRSAAAYAQSRPGEADPGREGRRPRARQVPDRHRRHAAFGHGGRSVKKTWYTANRRARPREASAAARSRERRMKNKNSTRKKPTKKNRKALLLGLGLDGKDEHVRITKGDNFRLVGGSKETHECMQEKAIKFNEELKKRGK